MNCVPPVVISSDKNCIGRILKQERDGGKEIIERYTKQKVRNSHFSSWYKNKKIEGQDKEKTDELTNHLNHIKHQLQV